MRKNTLIIIAIAIIILVLVILLVTTNKREEVKDNDTTEMNEDLDVVIEFLGEIKIDPMQTEPSGSVQIKIFRIRNEELINEFVTNEPYIGKIYNEKNKEIIERTYDIEIDFEEEYDDGKTLFCIGSKVKNIEITSRYYDELSKYKAFPQYYAKAIYEGDYDGNTIYFYRVNRADFYIE